MLQRTDLQADDIIRGRRTEGKGNVREPLSVTAPEIGGEPEVIGEGCLRGQVNAPLPEVPEELPVVVLFLGVVPQDLVIGKAEPFGLR